MTPAVLSYACDAVIVVVSLEYSQETYNAAFTGADDIVEEFFLLFSISIFSMVYKSFWASVPKLYNLNG